jgi:hypothetical protein
MVTCLFEKPLLSNGSCTVATFTVFAQQRVYMPRCMYTKEAKASLVICALARDYEQDYKMSAARGMLECVL